MSRDIHVTGRLPVACATASFEEKPSKQPTYTHTLTSVRTVGIEAPGRCELVLSRPDEQGEYRIGRGGSIVRRSNGRGARRNAGPASHCAWTARLLSTAPM